MPRIRTVKPEFWTDEKIVSLPYIARLFFIGLWNFADDYGALEDKPNQLKLLVLPNEERVDVFQLVDLLIASGMLERYVDTEEDKTFLVITNWELHQKVDHPAKSKIITSSAKKASIPFHVRRKVAEKYGCKPGEQVQCECYFCGAKGMITWAKLCNGSPSGWVSFSLELSHFIAEAESGPTHEDNMVLACRNCNRSMGIKHAFEWLLNGKYYTNHKADSIIKFRESAKAFESIREGSRGLDQERKGKEGIGKDSKEEADKPPAKERFVKPDQGMITDYFEKIGLDHFSAQAQAALFFDYYSSNGWRVGKTQMKDWEAAARNWKKRMNEFKQQKNGTHQQPSVTGNRKSAGAVRLVSILKDEIEADAGRKFNTSG